MALKDDIEELERLYQVLHTPDSSRLDDRAFAHACHDTFPALVQRLRELEDENKRLWNNLHGEQAESRRRITQLEQAFDKYGRHIPGCAYGVKTQDPTDIMELRMIPAGLPCDCGYTTVRAVVEASK